MRILSLFFCLVSLNSALAFEISSPSFENGKYIPPEFTCDGADISPELNWSQAPSGTKSFVLICEDPDSILRPWTHWLIFNIPADENGLKEGIQKLKILDNGISQGLNDFKDLGYSGPCPPSTGAHRYFFKVYALDIFLAFKETPTKETILDAVKGHILADAQFFGVYQR